MIGQSNMNCEVNQQASEQNGYDYNDLPPWLQCGHFDGVVISSLEDSQKVHRLIKVIEKFVMVRYKDHPPRPPALCTLDDIGPLSWKQSWVDRLHEALDRSTYSFFFLTASFGGVMADKQRDAALMKMIDERESQDTVIPLHTTKRHERRNVTPRVLRALSGIDITSLYPMLNKTDISDIHQECVDERVITTTQQLQTTLNQRVSQKEKKEVLHEIQRKKWLEERKLEAETRTCDLVGTVSQMSLSDPPTSEPINPVEDPRQMSSKEKVVLKRCRVFLIENIYDINCLMDDFIQDDIITTDTAESIKVKNTTVDRKDAFLDQLPFWGPKAFRIFLQALKRNKDDHVVAKLETELQTDS